MCTIFKHSEFIIIMNGRTHLNLTRMMYPHIPLKDIMQVNSRLDNAKMMDKTMRAVFGGKETTDFFGLTGHGHRKYNHDMGSALLAANLVSKQYGAKIAIGHLMQDTFSNMLVDKYGVEGRDLFEAVFNYSVANKRRTGRKRKTMYKPFKF